MDLKLVETFGRKASRQSGLELENKIRISIRVQ
jgi:hypothetical protein